MNEASINVNGGQLSISVGVANTAKGYVGRAYIGGTEIWETEPVADYESARSLALKQIETAFARVLARK